MRITLEEIIERHKKSNPNTAYYYGKTVLGQTLHDKVILIYFLDKKYNSYMKEDDIYFNKKEDLLKYIKLRLDNIIKK